MIEKRFVCTGGCGGVVSEEQYVNGATTCATRGCPNFGKPLVEKKFCHDCKEYFVGKHKHKK